MSLLDVLKQLIAEAIDLPAEFDPQVSNLATLLAAHVPQLRTEFGPEGQEQGDQSHEQADHDSQHSEERLHLASQLIRRPGAVAGDGAERIGGV
jgi:hypothetical protein